MANKNDLISAAKAKLKGFGIELTNAQATQVLKVFEEVIGDALQKDGKVVLPGFGVFEVKTRSARTARNPQTGKTIQVPEKQYVRFKAYKQLDEQINQ